MRSRPSASSGRGLLSIRRLMPTDASAIPRRSSRATPISASEAGSPIRRPSSWMNATGSGHTTNLGPLQANNIAPTIASLGTFTGKAGSPVYFSAVTTERCPTSSYVWKFSNGTTSYGPAPQRTFSAPGVYDGELTVTDESGLKAKRSFTVTVK